jgi:hypothetical protein
MNKPLALALLVVGVILLVFGVQASHSAASSISKVFSGAPTDKAIWLIIGGALASVAGLIGLARS